MTMELMPALAKRYPLAMTAFARWLAAQDTLHGYGRFVSAPVNTLPLELLYGIAALFFEACGVVCTAKATSHGKWRLVVHVRRITGRWDRTQPVKKSMPLRERMECELSTGFMLIDKRMKALDGAPADDNAFTVGLNLEAITQQLRLQNAVPC